MEPNLPALDVEEMLTWAAFFTRDIVAVLALATAAGSMMVALVTLFVRRQARLDARLLESGVPAWFFAALCCFAPPDQGLLNFTRLGVIGILVLSGAMWVVIFILRRYVRLKE
jgi:hypothetical protein